MIVVVVIVVGFFDVQQDIDVICLACCSYIDYEGSEEPKSLFLTFSPFLQHVVRVLPDPG